MSRQPIRIATRGSRLALWQAHHVANLLREAGYSEVEFVEVTTRGDQVRNESLRQLGGLGVFTRGVQEAVLSGQADLAVHSLKDLPTEPVDGLRLAAVPVRGPRGDALVLPEFSESAAGVDSLMHAARVGTGSPRRQAQLLHRRPDLQMDDVRGNLETRLRKLDAGQYDALVLAEAGLRRLGLAERISAELGPPVVYPAVSQGALGIECRAEDDAISDILTEINDRPTHSSAAAERSLLAELRAGCHAPLGVWTETDAAGMLQLDAVLLSPDGKQRLTASATADEAVGLGRQVAEQLKEQGAVALVEAAKP